MLLEELTDVLTRPSATKRLALIDKTTDREVLADFVETIEPVVPATVPRVVPDDADDDDVIAAAVDGQPRGPRDHLGTRRGRHDCGNRQDLPRALVRDAGQS